MTEKQNSVIICTESPKTETFPIYGNRCSFDQKRKISSYEECLSRLKSYGRGSLLLWKIIPYKLFSTKASHFFQLPTYPTNGDFSQQYVLNIPIKIQCSTLSKLNNISLCRKRCATTKKPNSFLRSHKDRSSISFASRR